MVGWGCEYRDRREESGEFTCPKCLAATRFTLYGVYRHEHLHIGGIPIPLGKLRVGEKVRCDACGAELPPTALAVNAPVVQRTAEACREAEPGIHENLGNVVQLTDAAAREILRRMFSAKFGPDTVARLTVAESPDSGYGVAFDYALADGNDWLGESRGIGIVVARHDTSALLGRMIDFRGGIFCDETRP